MPERYVLFVDLDGVLADFDRGVEELTGARPAGQSPKAMWPRLARSPGFYAHLPWTPDGPELWERVKRHEPVILTGLPRGNWAKPQKLEWCRRELGTQVPVIACMSREKAEKAREWVAGAGADTPVPVLIDDRESLRERWEEAGGIFIHHSSAAESIRALEELGL
jgi:hypothetical protein